MLFAYLNSDSVNVRRSTRCTHRLVLDQAMAGGPPGLERENREHRLADACSCIYGPGGQAGLLRAGFESTYLRVRPALDDAVPSRDQARGCAGARAPRSTSPIFGGISATCYASQLVSYPGVSSPACRATTPSIRSPSWSRGSGRAAGISSSVRQPALTKARRRGAGHRLHAQAGCELQQHARTTGPVTTRRPARGRQGIEDSIMTLPNTGCAHGCGWSGGMRQRLPQRQWTCARPWSRRSNDLPSSTSCVPCGRRRNAPQSTRCSAIPRARGGCTTSTARWKNTARPW